MIKHIDDFLNNITMYRLVLYYLIALLAIAVLFSFFGILPFKPFSLIFSTLFLVGISWLTNTIFAAVYKAPTNVESVYITALILAAIITPINSSHDLLFLGWATILAMASKYILAIKKKHIFNPAALSVVFTALVIKQSASWWVGTVLMLPFVFIGGLLIVRKIRRTTLVVSFLITTVLLFLTFSVINGTDLLSVIQQVLTDSPLFFFAFIMLTEPSTTPPITSLQILYGILVGFLFAPQIHFGSFYTTPEIALVIGNIFSYLVSPKDKLILRLKEKIKIAPDIYDFIFMADKKMKFTSGQYMEWTLGHEHPDSRGNRRYFTLASSPTEDNLRIGVKFYEASSSFKKSLLKMNDKNEVVVSQLAGEFILPKNSRGKYVFIAGGIGITPFRSILKNLLDTKQRRDIILFYANKFATEIVYKNIFDKAQQILGIKTIYALTDKSSVPPRWQGKIGRIDEQMIKTAVPDYPERTFYLSGPHSLVTAFEEVLKKMGIAKRQIKTDFFPGFV
jgi:ferredoxin-NADP reductase